MAQGRKHNLCIMEVEHDKTYIDNCVNLDGCLTGNEKQKSRKEK